MANNSTERNAAVAGVAALLGGVGFMFVFADLGEGLILRLIVSSAFFLLASAAIGYSHPNGWLMAMLISWGGVVMGGFIILMAVARYGSKAFDAVEPPYITSGILMLVASLVLTFFGGFLGKSLSKQVAPKSPE